MTADDWPKTGLIVSSEYYTSFEAVVHEYDPLGGFEDHQ